MMKITKIAIMIFALGICSTIFCQTTDRGNINVHFGSIGTYSTCSIDYESLSLLSRNKHQLRTNIRFGAWSKSIFDKNTGAQTSLGATYLFGIKHHLEFSSDIVFHFDKGLKGQSMSYIGATYRPFLGYRWENPERRLLARIGVGWYEVVQIGLGYKI